MFHVFNKRARSTCTRASDGKREREGGEGEGVVCSQACGALLGIALVK